MPSANAISHTYKCYCDGQYIKTFYNSQFHFAKAEIAFAGVKTKIPNVFIFKTQKNKTKLLNS